MVAHDGIYAAIFYAAIQTSSSIWPTRVGPPSIRPSWASCLTERPVARRKLAETKRKSDAPYRIAEHYNAGLAASANTSEHPRILPVETVPRAELTKRRLNSDGNTAPTLLKIIQKQ